MASWAGVDDAHGQPGIDGVVEKHRVDGFSHSVVAAERERNVADAAGGVNEGIGGLQPTHGVDEVAPVGVVFLNAGGDREDVGIEDDVFGGKAGLFHQQPIAARDDFLAARQRVRLAVLVERHDNGGSPVAAAQLGLFEKRAFAALQAD